MNRIYKYLITGLLLSPWRIAAQIAPMHIKNAVYAELSGWGYATLNYERQVWQQGKHKVIGRVGLLGVPERLGVDDGPYPSHQTIGWSGVASAIYLRGLGNHHLELGLTYTYMRHRLLVGDRSWDYIVDPPTYIPIFDDTRLTTLQHHFASARLGYRFQRPKGGLVFRLGVTPVTCFFSGNRNFTFGMARYLPGGRPPTGLVFLPIPDLSLGWSF
jgi:hypothetical protein